MFQSTHPRGVRLLMLIPLNLYLQFQSTHPRGVRLGAPFKYIVCYVSIHAPTWGATLYVFSDICFSGFQSTHPRGVRLYANDVSRADSNVSIHAPTWGATQVLIRIWRSLLFQSTHPRGVRHIHCSYYYILMCFNPRTHVGCDMMPCIPCIIKATFQSTHPRGVRLL